MVHKKEIWAKVKRFSFKEYCNDPEVYLALVPDSAQSVIDGATRNLGLQGQAILLAGDVA